MAQNAEEIEQLNIELLETLSVIGHRFYDYIDEYRIPIRGFDSLLHLLERADATLEQMETPRLRNPIIPRDDPPPDKATVYPYGGSSITVACMPRKPPIGGNRLLQDTKGVVHPPWGVWSTR
jgi:hypothetical protein